MVHDHDDLSRDDLHDLLSLTGGKRVSVYTATDRTGQRTSEDAMRLKQLLKRALQQLLESGMRRAHAEAMLAPATELASDPVLMHSGAEGLAIFMSEDGARRFRLARAFEDLVVVNDRFHIRQLLGLLKDEQRFYILALARKGVRLLECTRHRCHEIDAPTMPLSVAATLEGEVFQHDVSFHQGTPANVGAAMYYGHGGAADTAAEEVTAFFRLVDAAVFDFVKTDRAPLVLVGLAEETAMYRDVNRYAHVAEGSVPTGTQLLSDEEIRDRAWAVVAPLADRARLDALDRLGAAKGSGRVSRALAEVVPAAVYRRVDTLFIEDGSHRWGSFDPDTGAIEPHREPRPGDHDLHDIAAAYTLLGRGVVYPLTSDEMPGGSPLAALLRY
jgi:hypothetical protein